MKENPLGDVDGFTPEQRFFLAYATVWAANTREEDMRSRTKSDPHSLGEWRVMVLCLIFRLGMMPSISLRKVRCILLLKTV